MKPMILFMSIILFAINVSAEGITLRGLTVQYRNGKPITGVEIFAPGANPVASDYYGQFVVSFTDTKIGETVMLIILKNGMEVVNRRDCRHVIITDDRDDLQRIYLWNEGDRQKQATAIFRNASKNHDDRIAKIKAALRTCSPGTDTAIRIHQRISGLEQDWYNNRRRLLTVAGAFADLHAGASNTLLQKAYDRLEKGDLPGAFGQLKDSLLDRHIDNSRIKLDRIRHTEPSMLFGMKCAMTDYRKAIDELVFKAGLAMLLKQWDDAEAYYRKAMTADTADYITVFSLAECLVCRKCAKEAIRWYLSALSLAGCGDDSADALHGLGVCYRANGDYQKSDEAFTNALKLLERLSGNNSVAPYEPRFAETLIRSASVYRKTRGTSMPEYTYRRAAEILDRLAAVDPHLYQPDLAATHNELAKIYMVLSQNTAAVTSYEKALRLWEGLTKTNPAVYEPFVAEAAGGLGRAYLKTGDSAAATRALNRAVGIMEKLASDGLETEIEDPVDIFVDLQWAYYSNRNDTLRANVYARGAAVGELLIKMNPAKYEPFTAKMQNYLGILHREPTVKERALKRSLELWKKLSAVNPKEYERQVAKVLNDMGVLYAVKGETASQEASDQEALQIYEQLAKKDPQQHGLSLIIATFNRGVFHIRKKKYPAAEQQLKKSLGLLEAMGKNMPGMYEYLLISTLNTLGDLYLTTKEYAKADSCLTRSTKTVEQRLKADPKWAESPFGIAFDKLGMLYSERNEYERAEKAFLRAREIWKVVVAREKQAGEISHAVTLYHLGLLYKKQFETSPKGMYRAQGLDYAEKAIRMFEAYRTFSFAQENLEATKHLRDFFKSAE